MLKICDDKSRELDEIVSSCEGLQVVRVPGQYWHEFRVVGNEPATPVHFLNFHIVKPYLQLVTRIGLAIGLEGMIWDDRQGRGALVLPAGDREAGVGRNS